jgi:hypothetical protein
MATTENTTAFNVLAQQVQCGGINLKVQGREKPVEFRGEVAITQVKVDTAWARIGIGSCVLRTHTIPDRDTFVAWVAGGGKGKLEAMFYCEAGQLPAIEPEESKPFMSRSRAHDHIRHQAFQEMQQQLSVTS